jgi:acetate kinase
MAKSTTILSINAGSSSVKITLFTADGDQPAKIAAAEISGLGDTTPRFTYSRNDKKYSEELPSSIKGHNDAFQYILEFFLNDAELNSISSRDQIDYACHRVVHGVSDGAARNHKSLVMLINSKRVITQSRS